MKQSTDDITTDKPPGSATTASSGFTAREQVREQARATEGKMALYKSVEGFNEIMAWYEGLVDKITVPFDSHFVDTRFGRTHMLVCGPEQAPPLILVQAAAGSAPASAGEEVLVLMRQSPGW